MRFFTLSFPALLVLVGLANAFPQQKHFSKWDFKEVDSEEHGQTKGSKGTNCTCGTTNKANRRIVGGRETQENEYPHMAGVAKTSGYGMYLFCGSTIITEHHAVTAAHCTEGLSRGTRLMIVVGSHNTFAVSKHTKTYDVSNFEVHEGYDSDTYANDIALLTVYSKISFNEAVGPACLPTVPMNKRLVGDYVKVTGWGDTSDGGEASQTLLKVNLRVVPLDQCAAMYPIYKMNVANPTQFCTYRPNKDSCQGDSGGPVTWLDPETNRYTLVGLVSFGEGCATSLPGVNIDVFSFMPWLQAKIAKTAKDTASRKVNTCARAG